MTVLSEKYRKGDITDRVLWDSMQAYALKSNKMSRDDHVRLLQTQATLLMKDGYPILAAMYASKAVQTAENAYDSRVNVSWEILHDASKKAPIHNILESLATKIKFTGKPPKSFGSDWYYFIGNALERNDKYKNAIAFYSKVKISDSYYFPAKYHEAMAMVTLGDMKNAESSLRKILNSSSQELSTLSDAKKEDMMNMAKMALGRIYYEQKQFEKAFRVYRSVSKESTQYYDALFEQAWAFFMAGYPNHALGAIHSLQSPFFTDRYNPEASMLKSISYFWMCQYGESKYALEEFKGRYEKAIEGLELAVGRTNLKAESAYQLFENYIIGVSGESLGIPRDVIKTAVEQDSLMQVRNQYASVLDEHRRLSVRGVYGSKTSTSPLLKTLEKWRDYLKDAIGERFLVELNNLRLQFDSLDEQSSFLELELIMSEKDQLLGKELHADDKMTSVSSSKVYGWGRQSNQFWSDEKIEEYWWDEIGFYIYQVKPRCKN